MHLHYWISSIGGDITIIRQRALNTFPFGEGIVPLNKMYGTFLALFNQSVFDFDAV